jgi:putative addiction module component (TIGR02574 family)
MTSTIELSEAAEKLIPALDALSEKDRAGLARRLLAGLDGPEDDPAEVRAAWVATIRRRVEEVKSGKAIGIPAEEVDRMMREKYL